MGGGPGHMRHPHDLHRVTSGSKLIELFSEIKQKVESASIVPNVKVDGINVSFKYVGGEFAVDRGSLKEIDLAGITMARIGERFPEGHGMRPAITKLLTILNEAEPLIRQEISRLGLINNPHYFLNTEYVEGTTNAIGYNEDFIAIHGVNAFYKKTSRRGERPGETRPIDEETNELTKDPSVEVPYDKEAMTSLIEKLKPIAKKLDYAVYGPIPTSLRPVQIDFSSSLSTPIDISITQEGLTQKPDLSKYLNKNLGQLLALITDKPGQYPNYPLVQMSDGKPRNPYHKVTYLQIIEEGVPVDQLAPIENVEKFIKGAVYMHASRLLGGDVLNVLTSELGDMVGDDGGQEGVVIRDSQFSKYPFKLTGEFIKKGMYGVISQKMESENPVVSEEKIRKMVRESINRTYLAMLPRFR